MVCSQLGILMRRFPCSRWRRLPAAPIWRSQLAKTLRYNRGGGFTFPNGAHIAEVEIDPDTGGGRVATQRSTIAVV